MAIATPGAEANFVSASYSKMFSTDVADSHRARRETLAFSLLGQAAAVALLVYFTSFIMQRGHGVPAPIPRFNELPLIFSGANGGGGGGLEKFPASHGDLPRASLDPQLAAPTVRLPEEMPRLAVPETVVAPPDIWPQSGQIGDPSSRFSGILSDGRGGPSGIGDYGCCGGDGSSNGPHAGDGSPGIFPAGMRGVTVPKVIFSPEPNFSDEARKSKAQGIVVLMLVVGKDGQPYDIRVGQSLGMGLDEKAVEAVSRWRFRPATLNGQPVATKIAVEVDFRLY
jgi:periplasmic protein TonB